MALVPSKRRKLDHNSVGIPTSEDELQEKECVNKSKPVQSQSTRSHGESDGAIHAGGLYKSSIFKQQVDEMLDEMRPNYQKRLGLAEDALRKVKSLIEGIGARDPLSVSFSHIFMLFYIMLIGTSRYRRLQKRFKKPTKSRFHFLIPDPTKMLPTNCPIHHLPISMSWVVMP